MILLYLVLGVVALVGFFLVGMFIVCLWEKQFLVGDVEPAAAPYPYPPSPYWSATRTMAQQLGLQPAGDFATKKNTTLVKGLQTMFITPDRLTIIAVVSGSTAGAKLKKTVLRSHLVSGRVLESSDNPGIGDPSGVVDHQLLLNAGLTELLDFHQRRLAQAFSAALPFDASNVLHAYEHIDLERGARWVLLGLAYWVNPEKTAIRMTVRGALAHIKGMFRQMGRLDDQVDRTRIPRAGSRA